MAPLEDLFSDKRFIVAADLGANSLELARLAEEAGADVAVTHTNSGIEDEPYTGPPELEVPIISDIASSVSIPIALVLGGRRALTPIEMESILPLNLLFLAGMAHHIPAWLLSHPSTPLVVGVGAGYSIEQIEALQQLEAVKATAIKIQSSASMLSISALDLSTIQVLSKRLSKPLLLWPRTITEGDTLQLLWKLGCRGMLIPVSSSDSEDGKHRIMRLKESVGRLET